MIPVSTATAMNADTSPMVQPSLSMKNLQIIISTVPGLHPPGCKPATVGSHFYIICWLRSCLLNSFTLVKMPRGKRICDIINAFHRLISSTRLVAWPAFDPVNISGKYQGNGWPVPAGNGGLVFYRQSAPGTTSKEKCPTSMLTWHWLVFPAALFCKVRPVISYLLY